MADRTQRRWAHTPLTLLSTLALGVASAVAALGVTEGTAGAGATSVARATPHAIALPHHFPVAFILCDFKTWHYEPNRLSYYEKLWTKQNPAGTYSSLADFFHDVSFGQMDLAGSKVLGWYHMPVALDTWHDGGYPKPGTVFGNNNRISSRWLDCINAAEAQSNLSTQLSKFKAIVAVTPSMAGAITGGGIAAEPALTGGQTQPAPETFTVDSTKSWPPAPFLMSLPHTSAYPFGENVRVTKVDAATNTITITRGFNEGMQQPGTPLKGGGYGPFQSYPAGQTVVIDSDDDFGVTSPVTIALQANGQPCTYTSKHRCPRLYTQNFPSKPTLTFDTGVAQLFAGDGLHDGNYNSSLGDAAHEVGHATGYNHSRRLSTSTVDYNDCYDQMSYDACGTPGLATDAGPGVHAGGVIGYDAIDLEFHDWIPKRLIYNSANQTIHQSTVTLHALSDPSSLALKHPGFLDAHVPARIAIESGAPQNASGQTPGPTIPPTCTSGYSCVQSKYYSVEYRQLGGFDQSLRLGGGGGPKPPVGAVILHLYVNQPSANISYLVDSYPGQASGGKPVFLPHAAALQPGDDFADPAHHVYLAVNGFDQSRLDAQVTIGSSKLVPQLVYTGDTSGRPGFAASLSATLTVDGAPVPNQALDLSVGGVSCSAITTTTGRAACPATVPSGSIIVGIDGLGNIGAKATFAGDATFTAASTTSGFTAWSTQSMLSKAPSAGTDQAPSLARFAGTWYAAWKDATSGEVYTSVDNAPWSTPVAVSAGSTAVHTDRSPALAVAGGALSVLWTDKATGHVEYATMSGSKWSSANTVHGTWGTAATAEGPAAAGTSAGGLLVAWTDKSSHHLEWTTLHAGTWAPPSIDKAATTLQRPAVAAAPSTPELFLAWTEKNGAIGYEFLQTTKPAILLSTGTIPGAATPTPPALLAWPEGTTATAAWLDKTSSRIDYADFSVSGRTWGAREFEPQALTQASPTFAVAPRSGILSTSQDDVLLGWKGQTGTGIWIAVTHDPA